jgi:hypothetical protein
LERGRSPGLKPDAIGQLEKRADKYYEMANSIASAGKKCVEDGICISPLRRVPHLAPSEYIGEVISFQGWEPPYSFRPDRGHQAYNFYPRAILKAVFLPHFPEFIDSVSILFGGEHVASYDYAAFTHQTGARVIEVKVWDKDVSVDSQPVH